jgi:hypothetical protein
MDEPLYLVVEVDQHGDMNVVEADLTLEGAIEEITNQVESIEGEQETTYQLYKQVPIGIEREVKATVYLKNPPRKRRKKR